MKRFFSLILALSILVGCMSVLTSCGDVNDDGAQFSVYVGEAIYDFDPTEYYVNANAEKVMSLLFEPLFVLDEDGDLKKGMAEDYEIDKKTRKITIQIRESEWSNGVQVLANDFIYAWRNAILDANVANPAASLFYDIEGALEVKNGEKSIDDIGLANDGPSTIVITYREGADTEQLLRNLASVAASPVCQNVHEKAQDTWSKYLDTMACNGPFYVKTLNYEKGYFTLARNRGYHQLTAEIEEGDDPAEYVTPYVLFSDFGTDSVLNTLCDKCTNINPSINLACRDANDDGVCDKHTDDKYEDGCETCSNVETAVDVNKDGKCDICSEIYDGRFCKKCGDGVCDNCGVTSTDKVFKCAKHIDKTGTDGVCDNCGVKSGAAFFACASHKDADSDGVCDNCEGNLADVCENHVDKLDGKCDSCNGILANICDDHKDIMDTLCDRCGNEYVLPRNCPEHEDLDDNGKCDVCGFSFDDGCEGCKAASAGVIKLSYSDIENDTVFYMGDASLAERAANKDKAIVSDILSTYTYIFNTKTETLIVEHNSDCEGGDECNCTGIDVGSPVSNLNVRKALSLALDRNAIVNAVVFGKAATGFIPDAVSSELRKTELIKTSAQTSEAKALMKSTLDDLLAKIHISSCEKDENEGKCGCPSKIALEKIHVDCCTNKKNEGSCNCPERVIINLLINDNEQSRKIASIAKTAWEALDERLYINVVTETHSYVAGSEAENNYYDSVVQQTVIANASTDNSISGYDFDIVAVDWCMYTNDPFVGLASMSEKFGGYGVVYPTNTVGGADYVVGEGFNVRHNAAAWYNQRYDSYMNLAYTATNDSDRMAALAEAEKILISEMPIMPIMFNQSFAFVNENLKGFEIDGNGYAKFTEVENKLWDAETHALVIPEKKKD